MTSLRTALITGANRGIGLHVAQQLAVRGMRVVLTARTAEAAQQALAGLQMSGEPAVALGVDVGDVASIRVAADELARRQIDVDILINNAGIYPEGSLLTTGDADLRQALDVNLLGPVHCARAWMPGMLARGFGRVVNLSSGYGCFSGGLGGPAAYSVSKAALNAATLHLAADCRGDVKVVAVDPGWVRTRMGGPQAPRAVGDAAADVVWAATLGADSPNGVLWRRRAVAPW